MEFMKGCKDNQFDLAIVDPPYGINVAKMQYTQEDNRPVKQKNGSILRVKKLKYKHGEWDNFPATLKYMKILQRVSKNQIIWGINYMNFHLRGGRIIWDKCTPEGTSFSDCEIAFCSLHERVRYFKYMWAGMFQAKSLLQPDIQQGNKKLNEKRIHPTQKPVALYKWLLQNYAKEGDKILDTHLGSMSSVIAAIELGFNITGMEIDKDYFDAGVKRVKNHLSQLNLFQKQPELIIK